MTDWSDEAKARLEEEEKRLRLKAANLLERNGAWSLMARQELAVADDIRAMLGEIERLRAERVEHLGQIVSLQAKLAEAYEAGMRSVMMIRCVKHRDVPQYNRSEGDGAECAACEIEPRG